MVKVMNVRTCLCGLVVLMAAQFLQARGVVLVTLGCVGLAVLGTLLTPPTDLTGLYATLANRVLSVLAVGLTGFLAVRGQSAERALREQANLLDLTYDSIFSRNMDDTITFWNRAAQELYGWTSGEAMGKRAHELLQTTLPVPLDAINAELVRDLGTGGFLESIGFRPGKLFATAASLSEFGGGLLLALGFLGPAISRIFDGLFAGWQRLIVN